ncbi:MAG: transglutaminase domain-containing protein [Planctomycetes bacterium]|nr:transglutaminase domain-containing protein [Planctomycetota bacterium]
MTVENPNLTRRLALGACGLVALTALPTATFPPEWLLGFVGPALILLALVEGVRLRTWQAFAIAGALQIAAVATLAPTVPLQPLAALGCTLVPPLAYCSVRAWSVDSLRCVFLAFCIVLVAAILGRPTTAHVLVFLATAIAALAVDVSTTEREQRASWRGPRAPVLLRAVIGAQLIGASVVICLLAFRGIGALPAVHADPSTPHAPSASSSRSAGLSSKFEFDAPGGSPLALRADVVLTASARDGRPLPADLYLRCGAFERAGLDSWRQAPARARRLGPNTFVGRRFETLPERWIDLNLVVASELAFVPAGVFAIESHDPLIGDVARGTFRFAQPRAGSTLQAGYQNLHLAELDALPAPGRDALLEVPAEVERHRTIFAPLLLDRRVTRAVAPLDVAEAVATVLRERCEYALVEPRGPHGHSVLDFLDGDRRGFCMHFASATALALRMLGVPCRVGVGVYGGDESSELPTSRVFGSHHAHAWVEVPIEGAGWVIVDPTPPSVRPFLRWPETARDPLDPATDGAAARELAAPGDGPPLSVAVDPTWLAVAFAVLAIAGLAFRGGGARAPRVVAEPVTTDLRTARKLMAKVLAAYARRDLMRFPRESLESWVGRVGAGDELLTGAVDTFQVIRFGGRPLDAARRDALERAADD